MEEAALAATKGRLNPAHRVLRRLKGRRNDVVGTWRVTINPGPTEFPVYFVFNKGNTMTERASVVFGSKGSGVWEKIDKDDDANFAGMFEDFLDFDSDSVYDFRRRIRLTIHVDGDTISGTTTVEVFTLDFTTLLFTGFDTFEGTRMTVIRE